MCVCVCVQAFLKLAKTPLIKHSDMVEEMRVEAVEISVSGTYVYVYLIQESRAHVPPSLSHANDACIAARSREDRWGRGSRSISSPSLSSRRLTCRYCHHL